MRSTLMTSAALAITAMPRAFASEAPAAATTATKAPRVEPVLTSVAKIALPVRENKRGSESKYSFDALTEVGTAFGVKNKTAAQLSSIVSNANRKARTPELDANGQAMYATKEITGPDGVTKMTVPDTDKPKTVETKHFFAFDVTDEYRKANKDAFAKGGAFEGVNTLVFRDK